MYFPQDPNRLPSSGGYCPGAPYCAPIKPMAHGRFATYPIAVFAQRGFAVLRPNVRGSAGYGRDFRYANARDWGGGDAQDVTSGVAAMVTSCA